MKLGPVRMVYDGTASIGERDPAARRAALVAKAREVKGQGTASATVTMTISPDDGGSKVASVAAVSLTGRAAQTGRGIVDDVARRMIGQMAEALEQQVAAGRVESRSAVAGSREDASSAPARELDAGSLVLRALWDRVRTLFRRSDHTRR